MTNEINPNHLDALLGGNTGESPDAVAQGLKDAGLTEAAVNAVVRADTPPVPTAEVACPGGDLDAVAKTLPGYYAHTSPSPSDAANTGDTQSSDDLIVPDWVNARKPAAPSAVVYEFPSGKRRE